VAGTIEGEGENQDWIADMMTMTDPRDDAPPEEEVTDMSTGEPPKTLRRGGVELPNPDWDDWMNANYVDENRFHDGPPEKIWIKGEFVTNPAFHEFLLVDQDAEDGDKVWTPSGDEQADYEDYLFMLDEQGLMDSGLIPDDGGNMRFIKAYEAYYNVTPDVTPDVTDVPDVPGMHFVDGIWQTDDTGGGVDGWMDGHIAAPGDDARDPEVVVPDIPTPAPTPDTTPTPVTPDTTPTPATPEQPQQLTKFQEYLRDEHMDDFIELMDDPTKYGEIAKDYAHDDEGNIIIGSGGDEKLEAKLGLPEEIDAVKDPKGNIITMYNPYAVQPNTMDSHQHL
jgi:hypothetical protein